MIFFFKASTYFLLEVFAMLHKVSISSTGTLGIKSLYSSDLSQIAFKLDGGCRKKKNNKTNPNKSNTKYATAF